MPPGFRYEVVNAGVSGDTSAGGLSRLDWALDGDVRILIVALGGNDALRGLPVEELKRNLSSIIERAQRAADRGASRGHGSAAELRPRLHRHIPSSVSVDLARQHGVPLVPFLLEGVAGMPALNQRDGIHPTPEGARIVADTLWTVLRPLAERRGRRAIARERPPDHDRLSRRLEDRHERDRAADHPAPADRSRFRRGSSSRSSGRPEAASRRCSASSPASMRRSSGSVVIDGVDITTLGEDALARLRGEKIGFVFQFFHLIPSLTAYENVAVPMEIAGAPTRDRRAHALLERGGADRPGASLSVAAVRRRAAARGARARAGQRSADPAGRRADGQSRQRQRTPHHGTAAQIHRARGTTLVLVTHDAELAALADVAPDHARRPRGGRQRPCIAEAAVR